MRRSRSLLALPLVLLATACGGGAGADPGEMTGTVLDPPFVVSSTSLVDDAPRGTPYRVDVPGGTLTVVWTEEDHVLLTGPAVLVAEGLTDL